MTYFSIAGFKKGPEIGQPPLSLLRYYYYYYVHIVYISKYNLNLFQFAVAVRISKFGLKPITRQISSKGYTHLLAMILQIKIKWSIKTNAYRIMYNSIHI